MQVSGLLKRGRHRAHTHTLTLFSGTTRLKRGQPRRGNGAASSRDFQTRQPRQGLARVAGLRGQPGYERARRAFSKAQPPGREGGRAGRASWRKWRVSACLLLRPKRRPRASEPQAAFSARKATIRTASRGQRGWSGFPVGPAPGCLSASSAPTSSERGKGGARRPPALTSAGEKGCQLQPQQQQQRRREGAPQPPHGGDPGRSPGSCAGQALSFSRQPPGTKKVELAASSRRRWSCGACPFLPLGAAGPPSWGRHQAPRPTSVARDGARLRSAGSYCSRPARLGAPSVCPAQRERRRDWSSLRLPAPPPALPSEEESRRGNLRPRFSPRTAAGLAESGRPPEGAERQRWAIPRQRSSVA